MMDDGLKIILMNLLNDLDDIRDEAGEDSIDSIAFSGRIYMYGLNILRAEVGLMPVASAYDEVMS